MILQFKGVIDPSKIVESEAIIKTLHSRSITIMNIIITVDLI